LGRRDASGPLIAFTRRLREAAPIKYRDLPLAGIDQTRTYCNAWPMDTQHFGEQALSDKERVTVTAVSGVHAVARMEGEQFAMSIGGGEQ
jgi:uncharacterized protein YhjY with autotransporter beta-barrel domain